MKKKKKQNKKKIRFLIQIDIKTFIWAMIIVFALISTTATYAWFSKHREAHIRGFNVKVEVGEFLEISLDGEIWTHSINIESMKQLYGTYKDKDATTVALQAKNGEQRNYIPTEMLPVSSVGNVENGNLVFVTGKLDQNKLTDIKKCSEEDITMGASTSLKESKNADHPYLAFDIYLKNLSHLTENGRKDPLQLDKDSIITATEQGVGLENTVRVAFVKYGSTLDLSASGSQVRAIKANGDETVSIWEPNYNLHTQFAIKNNKRLSSIIQEIDTYAIKDNVDGRVPSEIADVSDTTDPALKVIYTNKPEQIEEGVASGTKDIYTLTELDGTTEFALNPSQITKVRVYLWIEGQDPDCIDLSSIGKEINATIKLLKPEYRQLITNNY